MNQLKLTRLNRPSDRLDEMNSQLQEFLYEEADFRNPEWMENLNRILDFQDTDGSFKLFCTYDIPSDVRVHYCHMPTYICTSILMKAYLRGKPLSQKVEDALIRGLEASSMRGLRGHGYSALKGQIEALKTFMEGGLREFIDLYPHLNPKFTEMVYHTIQEFESLEKEESFTGPWGEDYTEDIISISRYFSTRRVFVYGTLMKGESNHHFLENSRFLRRATVEGYEIYDVGWYPAIIAGEGRVIGELYEVPKTDMPSIDMLEGEGSLYIRKCEMASDGFPAYIYEFAQDTEGLERISSWKEYVWYVSYGSNMLYERFLCYIKGGKFEGSKRKRNPCKDTSEPIDVRLIDIPYDMYFGNFSDSWNESGVSFLDTSKEGHALGVAYLITREQFEHVASEENSGRFPDGTGEWYEDIISLGEMEGFEMLTISNNEIRPYNKPNEEYLGTLKEGIKENWVEMSDDEIDDYLNACIRK